MKIVDVRNGDLHFRVRVYAPGMHCLLKETSPKNGITLCFFPLTWFDDMEIELRDRGRTGKASAGTRIQAKLPIHPLGLLSSTLVSLLSLDAGFV